MGGHVCRNAIPKGVRGAELDKEKELSRKQLPQMPPRRPSAGMAARSCPKGSQGPRCLTPLTSHWMKIKSQRGVAILDVTLSEAASSEGRKFLERDSDHSHRPVWPAAENEWVGPSGGI